MKHDEALQIVETFMEKSGIRHFCTYICKGNCCRIGPGGCISTTCMDNPPERKIACSAFLCHEMKNYVDRDIMEMLDDVMGALNCGRHKIIYRGVRYFNMFLDKIPGQFKSVEFEDDAFLDLSKTDTKHVRNKIDLLIMKNIQNRGKHRKDFVWPNNKT